jgi:hypothetical protein
VAVLYRGAADDPLPERLEPIAAALEAAGMSPEPVPYDDGRAGAVLQHVVRMTAALAWVDPLSDDCDRAGLDRVLRRAAAEGVWLGAHPDVIDRLGTKDVLVSTRHLGWGSDTHRYDTEQALRAEFPRRLATDRVRVLKADRGNGGRTVWKIRLPDDTSTRKGSLSRVSDDQLVFVQHARHRDGATETLTLGDLVDRLGAQYRGGDGTGHLVDQEFIPGIIRGIVRCYLVGGTVVGFARQYPEGVRAAGPLDVDPTSLTAPQAVMGLPSPKTMYPADEPALASLRRQLENDWVPGAADTLGIATADLPALWDVDLLPAHVDPKDPRTGDGFVLCEVNASSVIPYPAAAPARLAAHVDTALQARPD